MGMMIDGAWRVMDRNERRQQSGKFVRAEPYFRNWITADGSPGPSGKGGFKAEAGRYHLYVSLACPWAHRTLIMRKLKGLEEKISLSAVHYYMGDQGWSFHDADGVLPDPARIANHIGEQDRPIVERQRPEELPLDLTEELHLKGPDAIAVEYRRFMKELGVDC